MRKREKETETERERARETETKKEREKERERESARARARERERKRASMREQASERDGRQWTAMRWQRTVGSLKLSITFEKEPHFCRALFK